MEDRVATQSLRTPEISESTGDPLLERAQEINDLIARRAFELFESNGFVHGRDLDHWLRAKAEILHPAPLEIAETETDLIVRAEVPGFSVTNLEVRVEPRRLCITGKRQATSERKEGKTVYSERQSREIFRLLDLPAEVDPSGVKATLSDGVLEVTMARAEAGKKVPGLAVRARVATA